MKTYPCTHTRVQKLAYMCYADYLCKTGKRLFEDRIYAFQHGPVIDSIYRELRDISKNNGKILLKYIDDEQEDGLDDENELSPKMSVMSIRSRILFSSEGYDKVFSIDETLKKYERVSTDELIELTHRPGSPWDHVKRTNCYDEISDELIKKYHSVESD